MAPTRTKKRKSTESTTSLDMESFPAPPTIVPLKASGPAKTPSNRSPIKKARTGITITQKQALIDNLQLEITERARKLRAQYNLQAQGMRTRIEIRVNRIPMAMRKANMGELFVKHAGQAHKTVVGPSFRAKPNSPAKILAQKEYSRISPSPQKPQKRLSDAMSSADKENEDVENPRKRIKPPVVPTRTASRKVPPSQVLSPRSANSRTIPRSPIRPTTAGAGAARTALLSRPVSPLKPAAPVPVGGAAGILTNMVEKAKTRGVAATRKATDASTAVGRVKRTAVAQTTSSAPKVGRGQTSIISESSESSTSTVIRKPVAGVKKEPVKKTVMSALRGIGAKKTPAAPAVQPKSTAPAGRVLRKRN